MGKYAGETGMAIVHTAKCKRPSRGVLVTITTTGLIWKLLDVASNP